MRQEAKGKRQKARGKRQEAKGKRQKARGKRQEAKGKRDLKFYWTIKKYRQPSAISRQPSADS
ncbi:hypothetical protein [Moorena sp. SIOASIH]|uniref:hypothetical protein n=1 Tax=Moorena sp. SIOASIH TaxID=2607817 RepID=UPI0026005C33|nr:hypothetical protein [Moorena sp. SIOASIH]